MRPKLMIWDFNGTIVDDRKLCFDIENFMLRERQMKEIPDLDTYLSMFSFPIQDYYRRLGYDFQTESFESLADEYFRHYTEGFLTCPVREGVLGTLEKIHALGIPQTMLSATSQVRLEEQVRHLGIDAYFGTVLGLPDDYAFSKVYRGTEYIRACGIAPDEVLFLGDTDHDYEAAHAMGCRCVLITGGHQSKAVLQRCGVPVVDSFEAFFETYFAET